MTPRFFAAGVVLLAIPVLSAAGQNQPISMEGHWHVDFERSFNPWAAQHPKSVTLNVMVDDAKAYEATETIVAIDGQVRTETIRAAYDGKSYPVEGSPSGVTVAMTRLPSGSSRFEVATPDGFHALIVCSVSDDQSTMDCDETDTEPKGVSKAARSVYLRD
jgi:hypothetical protein